MGEAQRLDRPPAFIPDMTIVLLQGSRRLRYVTGKNKTRTVMLIRYPDWNCNLYIVNKIGLLSIRQMKHRGYLGRPVKSKKNKLHSKGELYLDVTFHT